MTSSSATTGKKDAKTVKQEIVRIVNRNGYTRFLAVFVVFLMVFSIGATVDSVTDVDLLCGSEESLLESWHEDFSCSTPDRYSDRIFDRWNDECHHDDSENIQTFKNTLSNVEVLEDELDAYEASGSFGEVFRSIEELNNRIEAVNAYSLHFASIRKYKEAEHMQQVCNALIHAKARAMSALIDAFRDTSYLEDAHELVIARISLAYQEEESNRQEFAEALYVQLAELTVQCARFKVSLGETSFLDYQLILKLDEKCDALEEKPKGFIAYAAPLLESMLVIYNAYVDIVESTKTE